MPSKTTRAFRTISEAGEELDLQPHVLRFWESKFPQIKPMKRGGGRRFYRPEDIEFLRGIKILLHDEKHPIKDVQKLIRKKGASSVVDLGRSIETASEPKSVEDTVLVPKRIVNAEPETRTTAKTVSASDTEDDTEYLLTDVADAMDPHMLNANDRDDMIDDYQQQQQPKDIVRAKPIMNMVKTIEEVPMVDRKALEDALERLMKLRGRWDKFTS